MTRRSRSRPKRRAGGVLAAAWLGLLLLPAAPAAADLFGPDDTFSQAKGPLQRGITYSAALSTPGDLDYMFYDVAAGDTLHFTVRNTLSRCANPDQNGCPLWATLLDGNEKQVGGEGSTAGTGEVDYGQTDYIDWTFPQAGRYYVVVESSGDQPTYTLRLDPGRTGSRASVIRSIRVLSPQRGTTVRARLRFGQSISRLDAVLVSGRRAVRVGRIVRHRLAAGAYSLAVPVNSAAARATLRRTHRLAVVLRVAARSSSGQTQTVSRHVTLRG